MHTCACDATIESRTHIVRECEIYKEERDVIEMKRLDKCDMEEFDRLESRAKTISLS